MRKTLLLALVPFLSGCGVIFIDGPAPGWQEIRDVDTLERMAVSYPCTSSRTLVWMDGVVALAGIVSVFETPEDDSPGYTTPQEVQSGFERAGSVLMGLVAAVGTVAGATKTSDCRAFRARLLEERKGNEQAQASYEWLDELSPPPDLDVTAFDPVFGLPFNLADGN